MWIKLELNWNRFMTTNCIPVFQLNFLPLHCVKFEFSNFISTENIIENREQQEKDNKSRVQVVKIFLLKLNPFTKRPMISRSIYENSQIPDDKRHNSSQMTFFNLKHKRLFLFNSKIILHFPFGLKMTLF